MKNKTKRYLGFFSFLIVLLAGVITISIIGPQKIVNELGVRNSFIGYFLVAAVGGVSSLTSSSYYILTYAMGAAGLSPLLIGILGGIGVSIGDSLFYYIGSKGEDVAPEKISKRTEKISKIIKNKPKWAGIGIIYFYTGFTPFPNDIVTVPLGFLKYPYKRMILPLTLGNITATIIIAYLASIGYKFLF
ncbi:MAG: VTT domain-containing protein [Candidatus Pacearchaeota archaeon]